MQVPLHVQSYSPFSCWVHGNGTGHSENHSSHCMYCVCSSTTTHVEPWWVWIQCVGGLNVGCLVYIHMYSYVCTYCLCGAVRGHAGQSAVLKEHVSTHTSRPGVQMQMYRWVDTRHLAVSVVFLNLLNSFCSPHVVFTCLLCSTHNSHRVIHVC